MGKIFYKISIFFLIDRVYIDIFSEIYCSGEVLHTIQMAKIFNDSKTFVDMKLKRSPKETVQLFHEFMAEHADQPTKNDVIGFVSVSDSNIVEN